MASAVERPIIMPLSNPTSHSEAAPQDLADWTNGRALVATGSPYPPVTHNGATRRVAQCNNVYIFPAMGLGVVASGATRVTDAMFTAAATALGQLAPAHHDPTGAVLPEITDMPAAATAIAEAVAIQAVRDKAAPDRAWRGAGRVQPAHPAPRGAGGGSRGGSRRHHGPGGRSHRGFPDLTGAAAAGAEIRRRRKR
jgi:malic enzyme